MSAALPILATGWLRLPEMDTPDAVAWQMPTGTLLLTPRGFVPVIAYGGGVLSVKARAEGSA